MSVMASQITGVSIAYSAVCSGADQRKHQSSASSAFVGESTGGRWIPLTKGQWRGKCLHLMTSSWLNAAVRWWKWKPEIETPNATVLHIGRRALSVSNRHNELHSARRCPAASKQIPSQTDRTVDDLTYIVGESFDLFNIEQHTIRFF